MVKKTLLEQQAEEQTLQLLAEKEQTEAQGHATINANEYETPESSVTGDDEDQAETKDERVKKPVTPIPKLKFLLVSLVIMAEAFGYVI